jgi:hypothetical protein
MQKGGKYRRKSMQSLSVSIGALELAEIGCESLTMNTRKFPLNPFGFKIRQNMNLPKQPN